MIISFSASDFCGFVNKGAEHSVPFLHIEEKLPLLVALKNHLLNL